MGALGALGARCAGRITNYEGTSCKQDVIIEKSLILPKKELEAESFLLPAPFLCPEFRMTVPFFASCKINGLTKKYTLLQVFCKRTVKRFSILYQGGRKPCYYWEGTWGRALS